MIRYCKGLGNNPISGKYIYIYIYIYIERERERARERERSNSLSFHLYLKWEQNKRSIEAWKDFLSKKKGYSDDYRFNFMKKS